MAVIVSPLDAPVEAKIGEEETTYFFNKNKHAKRLLENLAEMQANGCLTDIVVGTGSKDYETEFHCMLLAAGSSVVKKRLVESSGKSIVLQEMNQEKLEFFKGFVYRSKVTVDESIIDDLHNFAVKYGIDELQATCEKCKVVRDGPSHMQQEIVFDDHEEVLLELFSMFLEKNLITAVLEDEKGQTQIEVHGPLIAAASPVLHEDLLEDSSAGDNDKLRLNISSDALREFVDYIYCAKVTLRRQNVLDLLQVACNYEMPALAKVCSDWVAARLDTFHVVRTLYWARELDSSYTEDLEEAAKSYLVTNFSDLTAGEEFNLLVYEDLKEIIQDEKLNLETEEDVFAVVMKWIEHDEDSRLSHLCDLLSCVRLEVTSREFLDELEDDPHIRRCSECFQLLREARQKLGADEDKSRPALDAPEDLYEQDVERDALSDDASSLQLSEGENLKDYESSSSESLPQDILPNSHEPSERRLRKDGRPDMRLKENRRLYLATGINKNGSPDKRLREHKETVLLSSRDKEMWPERNKLVIDEASSEERFLDLYDDMSSVSSPLYRGPFAHIEPARRPRLRKDGQPDMRFKEHRDMYLEDGGNKNGKPDRRLSENRIEAPGPLKKDGTPDMRYKANKDFFSLKERQAEFPYTPTNRQRATGPLKKNGTPDMRFKGNREASQNSSVGRSSPCKLPFSPGCFVGPVKKDGTPDMRYTVNKQLYGACSGTRTTQKSSPRGPVKKNGTPDMRYTANKQAYSGAPSSFMPCGPLKKNGTPDMRFKVNRR